MLQDHSRSIHCSSNVQGHDALTGVCVTLFGRIVEFSLMFWAQLMVGFILTVSTFTRANAQAVEVGSDGPGMAMTPPSKNATYLVLNHSDSAHAPARVPKSGPLNTSVLLVAMYKPGRAPNPASLLANLPVYAQYAAARGQTKALVMGASVLLPQDRDFKTPKGAYKILYQVPKGSVPGRPPWVGTPGGLGLHASAEGTGGVGVGGSVGIGRAYWGSILYVWDSCGTGHSGLAFSTGGGGLGGISVSGGAIFELTSANCLSDLPGWSNNVGGATCIGVACSGVTAILGTGYSGVDVFAGVGIGLLNLPSNTAAQLIGNLGFSGGSTFSVVVPFTTGGTAIGTVFPTAPGLALPANPVNFWGTPGVPLYNGPTSPSGSMGLPGFGPSSGPTMNIPGLEPSSGPSMYIPGLAPPSGPVMWIPGVTP